MKSESLSPGRANASFWSGLAEHCRSWWRSRTGASVGTGADDAAFQPYRSLARQLLADYPCMDGGRVLVVSSAAPISTDILLTLSYFMRDELGSRLLLVDGVGRDNGAGGRLGFAGVPGFLDLLHSDERRLGDLVQPTPRAGIAVLPPGRPTSDGLIALQAARVERVFAEARLAYDYVLLQLPAIAEDRGMLRFVSTADAVLLLVPEGRLGLEELTKCRLVLDGHRAPNVRVVLCATA